MSLNSQERSNSYPLAHSEGEGRGEGKGDHRSPLQEGEEEETAKLMKKKITRRAFCSMLLALPIPARAQQATKVPRIGYLIGAPPFR